MPLDDEINNIIQERNPTADAVNSLISVKKKKSGEHDSEIELKTDLTADEVKIHTIIDLMSGFLEMKESDFSERNAIAELVNKKERKALSKNRLSRMEIVEIARQPDMNFQNETQQRATIMQKLFRPHRPNTQ